VFEKAEKGEGVVRSLLSRGLPRRFQDIGAVLGWTLGLVDGGSSFALDQLGSDKDGLRLSVHGKW
jgi:hypothetical protein